MDSDSAEPDEVRVKLLFFGAARDAAGTGEVEVMFDAGATTTDAIAEVIERFPQLRRFGPSLMFALNQEYMREESELEEGDEVAVFPPVSGGSGQTAPVEAEARASHDFFEITEQPIDVGSVARRVVLPECGATVTLDGYAREWTRGRRTLSLVYEAYVPMALLELQKLGAQAHERFDISYIGIVHRIGRLEIGETSVVICVGAPHRRAAFEACEWAIKELKQTVPIWKKEVFENGEMWVEGEQAS